jgi:hypothetical protein
LSAEEGLMSGHGEVDLDRHVIERGRSDLRAAEIPPAVEMLIDAGRGERR